MNCLARWWSVNLICLVFTAPALAQVTPVVFERSAIRIDHTVPQEETATNAFLAPAEYHVEVRPQEAIRLEYIHTLNTLDETSGVMVIFSAPTMIGLPRWSVYQPVDVLFVAEDGRILQILPNAVLGNLAQEVMAKEPVKAFLFLKAGQVQAQLIKPKDVVSGPMFAAAPAIMQ